VEGVPPHCFLLWERRGAGASPLLALVLDYSMVIGETPIEMIKEVDDDGTLGMAE
jgi:hypothetical protein